MYSTIEYLSVNLRIPKNDGACQVEEEAGSHYIHTSGLEEYNPNDAAA